MATTTQTNTTEDSRFELLPEASYLVNNDMVITWANDAFFNEFNVKKAAVIGKLTCEEVCPSHLCGTQNCPVAKSKRIMRNARCRRGDSTGIHSAEQ